MSSAAGSPLSSSDALHPAPRRRWRRWLRGGAALLVFVALVLFFLPAILSTSIARGPLLRLLAEWLGVAVEAQAISLSWSGEQRLSGFRIGPAEEDILRLDTAAIESGLFTLLFSGAAPLAVSVDGPVLRIRRSRDGRFNIEPLFPRDAPRDPKSAQGGARLQAPEHPAPVVINPLGFKLPRLPRPITLRLHGGTVTYRDDVLETAADLIDLEVDLSITPSTAKLEATAATSAPDAASAPGKLSLAATLAGLVEGAPLQGLDVHAEAEVAGLALHHYRGLIKKLLRVIPPAEPLNGRFSLATENGDIVCRSRLNAGFVRIEEAAARLPITGGGDGKSGGSFSLSLPYDVDLAPALESLRPLASLPEGTRAGGRASGTIKLASLASLESLLAEGIAALQQAAIEFDVRATDLELLLPAGKVMDATCAAQGNGRMEKGFEGTGKIELAGAIHYQGFELEKLTADLRARGLEFALENVLGTVNGGRLSSDAIVLDLAQDPPAYRGTMAIDGAAARYEMAPLLAYAAPFLSLDEEHAELSGRLNGRLELSGRGLTREAVEKSLAGKGSLRIAEGKLSASRFFHEAAEIIGGDLGTVSFSLLGSDFDIGGGKITCGKVFLTPREGSKMRNLGLRGVTSFDSNLDFGVNLAALEETVGDKKIRKILQAARQVLADDMLPLRLKGTLASPELAIEARLDAGEAKDALDVQDVIDLFRKKRDKKEKKK